MFPPFTRTPGMLRGLEQLPLSWALLHRPEPRTRTDCGAVSLLPCPCLSFSVCWGGLLIMFFRAGRARQEQLSAEPQSLLSVLHLEGKRGRDVRGDPRPPSSKGGNRQPVHADPDHQSCSSSPCFPTSPASVEHSPFFGRRPELLLPSLPCPG